MFLEVLVHVQQGAAYPFLQLNFLARTRKHSSLALNSCRSFSYPCSSWILICYPFLGGFGVPNIA